MVNIFNYLHLILDYKALIMRHLFIFLFILFAGNICAQTTVTAIDFNPQPGENFILYLQASPYPTDGGGGANVIWDFHELQMTTITDTMHFDTCSNTPACGFFTGSNIAAGTPTGGYAYYNTSASAYVHTGAYEPGVYGDTIVYSGDTLLRYPLTYNNSFGNNYTAINYISDGITAYDTGMQTVTCDGYGTLILPTDTVQNVLRIHALQTEKDVTNGIFHITYDKYYWIAPGYHNFLMQVEYYFCAETQFHDTAVSYSIRPSSPASVANVNTPPTLHCYPNPAKDLFNIDFSLSHSQTASIVLLDMMGRQVATIANNHYQAGVHQLSYNVSSLPAGIYLVRIQSDAGSVTQKVDVL